MIIGLPPQLVFDDGIVVELEQRDEGEDTLVTLKVREGKKMRAIGAVRLGPTEDPATQLVADADVAVAKYRREDRRRKKMLDV